MDLPAKRDRAYKLKTITRIINQKLDDWAATISDRTLRDRVRGSCYVTGGAIASLLLGEPPNDYDIYLTDVEVAAALAEYYLDTAGKPGARVQILENRVAVYDDDEARKPLEYFVDGGPGALERKQLYTSGYAPLAITSNAITLSDGVQIILRFVGPAEVVHKNYDFVHTTNWCGSDGLVLNEDAVLSIMTRELRYVGSLYPVCSMFRLRKFIRRGWTISAGELLKIAYDISELDLTSPSVLREQLVGVDVAYFNRLCELVEAGEVVVVRDYLFNLIDTVFDDRADPEGDEEMDHG